MTFFTDVILWSHTPSFPSVSSGETFALRARHAPKGFIPGFLPIVIVPIQFELFRRDIFLGNTVIRVRIIVRSGATINGVTTGPLPAYQAILAVMIVIAVPWSDYTIDSWDERNRIIQSRQVAKKMNSPWHFPNGKLVLQDIWLLSLVLTGGEEMPPILVAVGSTQ